MKQLEETCNQIIANARDEHVMQPEIVANQDTWTKNFDPKLRRIGSAFQPVLSSKSDETTSWLRNGSLLAKRYRSPLLAEEYRIDKLESFVENFFTPPAVRC